MRLKLGVYETLVNRVPDIRARYQSLRRRHPGRGGRLLAWGALLGMNLQYLFGKGGYKKVPASGRKAGPKRPPAGRSESSLSVRETPEQFALRLAAYDVISFDVFDTLILRAVSEPKDVFYFVGDRLEYLDFRRLRREAEEEARRANRAEGGSGEIALSDIYEELEARTGIPKEEGMRAELEAEKTFCFANPYLLETVRLLSGMGKKIVAVSDMYLSAAMIRDLAEHCGYSGIEAYFVSCEYGVSKGMGDLYDRVKEALGEQLTYIHVGDHPQADGIRARDRGFHAVPYRNVNEAGNPYRAGDMSAVTGSIYRGTVNAKLHNGLRGYSREYELGYVYGGILTLGYCRFIHEYVRTHRTDKLLFLSRDGDILNQAYGILYPEERKTAAYVPWSRLAALKLGAAYYQYDYFTSFLYHKKNGRESLNRIFASMELTDLLPGLCRESGGRLNKDTLLSDGNIAIVEGYLRRNWNSVLQHYKEQSEAGRQYYSQILKDCRKACAVDIGWAGSGAVMLNHIVNRVWKLNCEITGLTAGTNSAFNQWPDRSEAQLHSGRLVSYLYSQQHNRDLWSYHDDAKGHNVVFEYLMGSPQGSVRGFCWDENKKEVQIDRKECDIDKQIVAQIHRGILDFVRDYPDSRPISGRDVYAALMPLTKDRKLIEGILKTMEVNV